MAQLFSLGYFEDLAKALNESPEFKQKTASLSAKILMVEKESQTAFLLTVDKGTATTAAATPDTPADFKFIGERATWIANHKGEAPMEKLVMTGKLKFVGSLPKIMGVRSQLGVIDKIAQGVPAEF